MAAGSPSYPSPSLSDIRLSSPSSFSGSGSERSPMAIVGNVNGGGSSSSRRTRSSRACDQCRRNKNRCEPFSTAVPSCRSCVSMGVACTFANPSRKRGPPKGYILALERRLQQVEALLGAIIGSRDPRARTLIDDISRDPLASHIMRRVQRGPFSPTHQPLGTTKQDFLESMIMSDQDNYDGPADDSFTVPDFDWHQRIQDILEACQTERMRRQSIPSHPSNPQQQAYPPRSSHSTPTVKPVLHTIHHQQPHQSHGAYNGSLTPVDSLSPLTPTGLTTLAPSPSGNSPIHTPGNSPYPFPSSYMALPSAAQVPPSAAPGGAVPPQPVYSTQQPSQSQYSNVAAGASQTSSNSVVTPNGHHSQYDPHSRQQQQQPRLPRVQTQQQGPTSRHSPNGHAQDPRSSQVDSQQQAHSQTASQWFQDLTQSTLGDDESLRDTKPDLGLGPGAGAPPVLPIMRVYNSAGYDHLRYTP